MLKLIKSIIGLPIFLWRQIFPLKIRERFGAYEDITERSNKELEKLDKVIDMMSGSFLSYRIRSIMGFEKRAVKAYTLNRRHVNDVWLTNPKESPHAAKPLTAAQNGTVNTTSAITADSAQAKKEPERIIITAEMLN
jgi:hypothetical protein